MPNEHEKNTATGGRYDLTSDEINTATRDFFEHQPGNLKLNQYECFRINDSDSAIANVARTLECSVFDQAFGNGPEDMHELYGPYEYASHFYVVFHGEPGGPRAIGALRAMAPSETGFTTINTLPDNAMREGVKNDPSEIMLRNGITASTEAWDIGTAAIEKGHRKTVAGLMLYRGLYKDARDSGVEYILAVLDKGLLGKLRSFGIPLHGMEGVKDQFEYYGSEGSSAVIGRVPEFHRNVISKGIAKRGIEGAAGSLMLAYGWGVDRRIHL